MVVVRTEPGTSDGEPLHPGLPEGRVVALVGRGSTWSRQAIAPPGAPTVLLLHGWTANADLNWSPSYGALAERYGVVTLDHLSLIHI